MFSILIIAIELLIGTDLSSAKQYSYNRDLYLKYPADERNSSTIQNLLRGGVSSSENNYRDRETRRNYFVNAFSASEDSSFSNGLAENNADGRGGRENSKEREQLYEAYNLLHSLAQVQSSLQFSVQNSIQIYACNFLIRIFINLSMHRP